MKRFVRVTNSRSINLFVIFLLVFSLFSIAIPPKVSFASIVEEGDYGAAQNFQNEIDYKRATVNKQVTLGTNPGEYFIDLTVKGKDNTTIDTTDIVLVYDNSNSMNTHNRVGIAKTATTQFVEQLLNGPGNFQMGLITFGSVVLDGRINNAISSSGRTPNLSYKGLTTNASTITSLLPSNVPNDRGRGNDGGTFTQQGLEEAGKILANSTADHKIIVTTTDGVPTFSYGSNGNIIGNGTSYTNGNPNHGIGTKTQAENLKASYELYTLAIELADGQGATKIEAEQLMRDLSSSPDHAYFDQTVDQLVKHLNDIIRRISNSVVDGSIEDPMGEYFILQGADNFTKASDPYLTDGHYYLSASDSSLLEGVSVTVGESSGGQSKINIDGLNLGKDDTITLRYKVQADTDKEGFEANQWYPTNGPTLLIPRGNKPDDRNEFPQPEAKAKPIAVAGEKHWEDGIYDGYRPESMKVHLMRPGKDGSEEQKVAEAIVIPDINDRWTYEFPEVTWYDSNGEFIDYYIIEEFKGIQHYKMSIS